MNRFLKKLYNYWNDCTLWFWKELILWLIIFFVWLISFSNAWLLNFNQITLSAWSTYSMNTWDCAYMNWNYNRVAFYENWQSNTLDSNHVYCYSSVWYVQNKDTWGSKYFYKFNISSLFPTCEVCEECDLPYTSEECQQEYWLMPIDSCNSEYCELNWLCETIWWSWSSTLYINDVWHEAAPFIYVNIPDEIKRDYLTWINEFTINVEWLNGDQDYINWIIDVNSYRPTSEDFTQTFVWWLTLIFPYIIITAVILFIRRFIRKIFK